MTVSHQVDAVILVGGKGTRLRPLTLSAPKAMLRLAFSTSVPPLMRMTGIVAVRGFARRSVRRPKPSSLVIATSLTIRLGWRVRANWRPSLAEEAWKVSNPYRCSITSTPCRNTGSSSTTSMVGMAVPAVSYAGRTK